MVIEALYYATFKGDIIYFLRTHIRGNLLAYYGLQRELHY